MGPKDKPISIHTVCKQVRTDDICGETENVQCCSCKMINFDMLWLCSLTSNRVLNKLSDFFYQTLDITSDKRLLNFLMFILVQIQKNKFFCFFSLCQTPRFLLNIQVNYIFRVSPVMSDENNASVKQQNHRGFLPAKLT